MTELEWLDCKEVGDQNAFLMSLGDNRKLQLFYCACSRRAYDLLNDEHRDRISQMVNYFLPSRGVVLGEVWEVIRNAIETSERFADGHTTDAERKKAAQKADDISSQFGDIAACAPVPGEDPNYDDAAVKMGGDLAGAAYCAAFILPSAAELSVRVVANSVAYDNEAYYAGAEGTPEIDPMHPHLLARRAERSAQWKLLQDIFDSKQ